MRIFLKSTDQGYFTWILDETVQFIKCSYIDHNFYIFSDIMLKLLHASQFFFLFLPKTVDFIKDLDVSPFFWSLGIWQWYSSESYPQLHYWTSSTFFLYNCKIWSNNFEKLIIQFILSMTKILFLLYVHRNNVV